MLNRAINEGLFATCIWLCPLSLNHETLSTTNYCSIMIGHSLAKFSGSYLTMNWEDGHSMRILYMRNSQKAGGGSLLWDTYCVICRWFCAYGTLSRGLMETLGYSTFYAYNRFSKGLIETLVHKADSFSQDSRLSVNLVGKLKVQNRRHL